MADACAAQIREYPAATVGQAWKEQLAAVEAHVWWTHDDHFVDAWADRQGVDRMTIVAVAIEVLALLLSMPSVEPALPMPPAPTQ